MKRREIKRLCYQEQLENEVNSVQSVLNQLLKLPTYENIDQEYLQKDFIKTQIDLELALASLCIVLRKMHENNFLRLSRNIRKDVNSIIHSNKFTLRDENVIIVHSQQGREDVYISTLLLYAREYLPK